jgi:hypothetical protein
VFDIVSTRFFQTGLAPAAEQAAVLMEHQWEHEAAAREPQAVTGIGA